MRPRDGHPEWVELTCNKEGIRDLELPRPWYNGDHKESRQMIFRAILLVRGTTMRQEMVGKTSTEEQRNLPLERRDNYPGREMRKTRQKSIAAMPC